MDLSKRTRWRLSLAVAAATVVVLAGLTTPGNAAVGVERAVLSAVSVQQVSPDHPRLLADGARFSALKTQINSDAFSKKTYASVVTAADALLSKPVLTYAKPDGVRILDTSREMVERAYTLGFAWHMSGDSKYAERLWKDLDAVTRFSDWNPDHFLDTAEMTHAVAIGYDWLYSYWSPDRRKQLSNAIIGLGLKPAVPVYEAPEGSNGPYAHGGNWAQNTNNWNIVVNSGLAVGAMAVAQDDSVISNKILAAATTSIKRGIATYANGGGYPEGLSYWDYATRYLVLMVQSLRSATGGDAGLSALPGLSITGLFPIYLSTPSGERFNFGDSEPGVTRGPVLAGLGDIYKNASFTYAGINEGKGGNPVLRLLWYAPGRAAADPASRKLSLDRNFPNSAVASFRSSWSDPGATFVGFRNGSMPAAGHQHLDAGTFNLDALGENWAAELGKDNYGLVGYFDEGAAGERWNYYRLAAEGQNTLVINPYKANPTTLASTPAARFQSNLVSAFSVADLSALYPNDVTSWKRGVKLFDGRQQVIVQDEIRSSKPVVALWSMHTGAAIEVSADGRSATLTKNGKQMLARIVSQSATAKFSSMPAAPLPSSPHPAQQDVNVDIRKLAIEVTTNGNTTLSVQFTPLSPGLGAPQAMPVTALSNWKLEAEGTSRAEGIRVGGKDIPGFSPSVFSYKTQWDPGSAVPSVAAYKTGATVTSTLPDKVPGVATTTVTEPGKSPTTYRILIERGPMSIKSAVATKTTEGSPSSTFDGDPSTYWTTWRDNSITYTLDEPRSIKSLIIDWRANRSRHTKFEVLTSWNGSTWTTRYDGAYDGSSGSQLVVPASSAWSKYVRIVGHGDEGQDPKTSLSEIRMFNFDVTPPAAPSSGAGLASVSIGGVPETLKKPQTATMTFVAKRADGRTISADSLSNVKYMTGDAAVATISDKGVVTATGAGQTSLGVVVTMDGVSESASVTVKVQDPLRVRLYPDADSWVRGGASAGTNYAKDAQLAVKPTSPGSTDESYTRLAYMGFDISQIKGADVASAVLVTTAAVTEPSGDRLRLDAHAVDGAWTESGLTYNNRPSLGATVGSTTLDATFAERATDITHYVAQKAAASATRLSLGFTQDTPFLTGKPLIAQIKSRESSTPAYIDVVLKPEAAPAPLPAHLSSVELTGVPSTLALGADAQVGVVARSTTGGTIDPAALTVSYASTDANIVTVSSSGRLVPKAVGSASVQATVTTNGASVTQEAEVKIIDPSRVRLYAKSDSYVRGGESAGTNFGAETRLPVKPIVPGSTDDSYTRVTYLGFDLSQLGGKKVASATLFINSAITEAVGDRVRLDIRAVETAWTETGVTFENRPQMLGLVGSVEVSRTFEYVTANLTDYVNSRTAISADSMSLGFTQDAPLLTEKPVITQIRSRESPVPPYLDIVLAD